MLWTDPKGRLWLFYGVVGNNKLYDGVGGAWAVICDDPNAENPKWGEPFRLSYYGDPRRPVKIEDKWYIAVDGWRFSAEYPPESKDHVGPHIYELDWESQKIKHVSQLPPNNNGQYSGFFETEFVQRSDGSVLALLRSLGSNSQMQYSVSRDLMRTWTPWQDYTVTAPSASSRAWLGRTPSGLLLLCWNNDLVRGTLTVGLSDDDGATYRYKKLSSQILLFRFRIRLSVSVMMVRYLSSTTTVVILTSRFASPRSMNMRSPLEKARLLSKSSAIQQVSRD